ncbi:LysR family transcriptional regulator [Streptomyces sp. NPDC094466]|uniref:LysR family transcriptional regulator n=1 Tax=Streptomyces sp. NPDC094466 TaxID=3366065 RepID=UPI003818C651
MSDGLGFSLAQLRYFVVSAEVGNISEAAEQLCASQSTVSSAVMRLERQLGVQLLLRHHARGVSLTPSGRHLLREARDLLGRARNLKERGDALAGDATGRLDVGFLSSLAPFLLPAVHRLTRQRYPDIRLTVHEEPADRLAALLREGHCELAVTYDFLAGDARFHALAELPVHAVVADGDPLGRSGPVELAELATRPLVTPNAPDVVRHAEKLFANAGVPLPRVIGAASVETTRGLVAAGSGFALMYQRTEVTTTLDGGTVRTVEIAGDLPPASLGVAMMHGLTMSGRGMAFLDVLGAILPAARSGTRPGGP